MNAVAGAVAGAGVGVMQQQHQLLTRNFAAFEPS